VSTGIYRITFADRYPSMISFTATLTATTPGDVKGHTAIAGALVAGVIDVHVFGATESLHDLAAVEWLNFVAIFKNTNA
jgi:hypothetical protein